MKRTVKRKNVGRKTTRETTPFLLFVAYRSLPLDRLEDGGRGMWYAGAVTPLQSLKPLGGLDVGVVTKPLQSPYRGLHSRV